MSILPRTALLMALAAFTAGLPLAVLAQPLPPRQPDAPRQIPRAQGDQPLPPNIRPPNIRPPKPLNTQKAQPEPPKVPPLPSDPAKRLDALFARLQDRENPVLAKKAETEIEKLLERSGSATVDLLFERAKLALIAKDTNLALDMLDYVTTLQPHFAGAYHRRAMVHLMRHDEEAALRDIKATLGLEPRHYLALTGLAGLMRKGGDKKNAYKALTRVNEINPWIPEIKEALEQMRLDIEGQKI
jgi:tetratricopeptide (TPR) repeat protein